VLITEASSMMYPSLLDQEISSYHGDADVGVDTEPGSGEAAQSRAFARPLVDACGPNPKPADCREKNNQ